MMHGQKDIKSQKGFSCHLPYIAVYIQTSIT